jgi:hypothetical protein
VRTFPQTSSQFNKNSSLAGFDPIDLTQIIESDNHKSKVHSSPSSIAILASNKKKVKANQKKIANDEIKQKSKSSKLRNKKKEIIMS